MFHSPDNSHSPILINNNSDFTVQAAIENWTGDGTISNPYVIEGVTFQGDNHLIEIRNTNVYFIIRNCILSQASSAFYLYQVSNGHLFNNTIVEGAIFLENSEYNSLSNNTVVNSNLRGIYLSHSGNNVLSNNLVTTCDEVGIHLYFSPHCTLSHNTVTGNARTGILADFSDNSALQNNIVTNNREEGICLYFSENCSVTDNFLMNNREQGIRLHRSANNVITNNDLGNNWFTVSGGSLKHFIQAEIANNVINGKPLIYLQHVIGGSVPYGAGAIILVNSSFISVSGQRVVGIQGFFCSHLSIQTNVVLNSSNGIQLQFSNTSVISSNYVDSSNDVGIRIGVSRGIVLLNNTVSKSTMEGIGLYSSENSTLTNNTVTFNSREGIYLYDSENSTLINNTVSNNNMDGIRLNTAGNSTLLNNTVINNNEEGIYLYRSGNITARYNILVNNSFSVSGWLLEHYIQTEFTNNLINNKLLVYWQHVTNQLIPPGAGMVILVNCSLISVINQQLVGILGAFSSHLFFRV